MKKTIIAYFSASGVTKSVALKMKDVIGCDIFEITPVNIYTNNDLNWNDKQSRSSKEMEDKSARPKVLNKLNNVADYDNVVIAFPIWWGVAPRIINTFIEENNLNGKRLYVLATSGGSGVSYALEDLKSTYPNLNFVKAKRFNGLENEKEYKEFIN